MKKTEKILSILLAATLIGGMLTACSPKKTSSEGTSSTPSGSSETSSTVSSGVSSAAQLTPVDQLAKPEKGDTIATISIKKFGDVKIRLFPNVAPKAVENFVGLAKKHYYDGLKFHRVIRDFMIQGGDPKGDGTGGQSIWGKGFGVEYDGRLRHYNGALACARTNAPNSNGSQFYIVNNTQPVEKSIYDKIVSYASRSGYQVDFPAAVQEKYAKVGGHPDLDGNYTVFGQTYQGLDVIEKVMQQETNEGDDSPITPILIKTVTISTYSGK